MSLRCECGGSVEAVYIETGRHGGVLEHFECQSCGRSGGYGVDGMTNDRRTWGAWSVSNTENREAGAFWFEIQGDRRFVCFDTLDGRTLAVEVTDASFGGEIEVADETGAAP